MSHALFARRRFLQHAVSTGGLLAFAPLLGCSEDEAAPDAPTPRPEPMPNPTPTPGPTGTPPVPVPPEPTGVPTAQELLTDPKAVARYEKILKQLFDRDGLTKDTFGRPAIFEDIEQLVADSLPGMESSIGHYAYQVPGDSIEHVKVAARFWGTQMGIGPFFTIDAGTGKQDYYPIAVSEAEAKQLLQNKQQVPRVGDDGKVNSQWPVFAAVCKPSPSFYVEFNVQALDTPSTFRDMYTPQEGGLHHFAINTTKHAADKAALVAKGFQPASNLLTSVGVNYFDARHTKSGMVMELLEVNVFLNYLFDSVYALCKADGAKSEAVYQQQIESNIFKGDVSKDKAQRGYTVPLISTLIDWAATEGPLRHTDPRGKAYRDYIKANTGKDLVPLA